MYQNKMIYFTMYKYIRGPLSELGVEFFMFFLISFVSYINPFTMLIIEIYILSQLTMEIYKHSEVLICYALFL